MRDPGSGVKTSGRKSTPKLTAGSTDVTNSPAGRASRAFNNYVASLGKSVTTRGKSAPSRPVSDAPLPYGTPGATPMIAGEGGQHTGRGGSVKVTAKGRGRVAAPGPKALTSPAGDSISRAVRNGSHVFGSPGASAPPSKHTPPKVNPVVTHGPGSAHSGSGFGGSGSDVKTAVTSGTSSTSATPDPNLMDLQSLLKRAGGIGTMLDAKGLAAQLANAQYGPVIQNLLDSQAQAGRQGKQDQADITNWYGQVDNARTKAASDLSTANTAAQGSLASILKGITGSIGGAANPGSAQVDAVGQNGINTEAALGNIQQGYLSSIAPLLELAKNGALSSDKARTQQSIQDLAAQTAAQQGSQQASQIQSQLGFQQQNDQVGQQRFQNQFGILQAIMSQQLAGQNANNTTIMDGARLSQIQAEIAKMHAQAQAAQYKAAHPAPAKNSFLGASSSSKATVAAALAQAAAAAGGAKNVQGAWAKIAQGLSANGWNPADPTVRSWVGSAVLPAVNISPNQVWGNG